MPITFLTSLERKRYEQMPEDIREGDLRQFFHLTIDDLTFIKSFYSNVNRIAVGIRIGLLRYLGFVPNTWKENLSMLFFDFIIKELGIEFSYVQLLEYGKREQTQTEHLNQILKYLQFRKWQPLIDEPIFEQWLVQQGMEHDNERYLLVMLCEKLHREKILRPAIGTLESLVAGIRERLEVETYQRLSFLWTDDFEKKLDNLLEVDTHRKITLHRWLCNVPSTNSAKEINQMFEKIDFLTEMGVKYWDLSKLSENRKKRLAHAVRRLQLPIRAKSKIDQKPKVRRLLIN